MYTKLLNKYSLNEAVKIIKKGGVVVFPTETVYGIGARINSNRGVSGIFKAKRRPADNPLIVHVSDKSQVDYLVSDIPDVFYKLVDAFWPGPLTLILKKSEMVSDLVSAGLDTVAIRMPRNTIARNLIKRAGVPICAPSANLSGRPSATKFIHSKPLIGRVNAIIDGQGCEVGLESTVLDITKDVPVLLRKGYVTKEDIESVIGKIEVYKTGDKIISPGLKYKHYSPKTKVIIIRGTEKKILEFYAKQNNAIFVVPPEYKELLKEQRTIKFYETGDDLMGANRVFSLLNELDSKKYDIIFFVDISNNKGVSEAVMDRLYRASNNEIIEL